jgi:hypothetical protein
MTIPIKRILLAEDDARDVEVTLTALEQQLLADKGPSPGTVKRREASLYLRSSNQSAEA